MEVAEKVAREFNQQSIRYVHVILLPRIETCVEKLTDEDLWWRPNAQSNSIGNLLLHLSGNIRQWIISGVGQTEDNRQRDLEFSNRGPVPKEELLQRLRTTVEEAVEVIAGLDASTLLETRHIQIYDPTVLEAVLHVVEHFSHHTGQILYITKMLRGEDLRFYDL